MMKTKHIWFYLLFIYATNLSAQVPKNKYEEAGIQLVKNYKEMLDTADSRGVGQKEDTRACEPFMVLKQFSSIDLLPNPKPFEVFLKNILEDYNKKLNGLQKNIIKDNSSKPNESYLVAVSRARRFKDFAEDITGVDILNIGKNDKTRLLDYYVNHPLKTGASVSTKGQKIAAAKYAECYATTSHVLIPSKWKYPKITWKIKTTVTITCECVDDSSFNEVNEAVFVYDAFVKGMLTTNSITFKKTVGPTLKLVKVSCCLDSSDPIDEASIDIPNEELVSLPQQTIGVSAGVGFSNDFKETNLCLGAEYLYNVTEVGNSSLFVGGNVVAESNSINDFSNTIIGVGPTVQLFTPINENIGVHMTNGISGGILFGNNDNNGVKDDISGFEISLNTGLNVPLSEDIALSIIVPLITHTNLEFSSQEGNGTFKNNSTDIFLFKNSPVKFGVRIDIGN